MFIVSLSYQIVNSTQAGTFACFVPCFIDQRYNEIVNSGLSVDVKTIKWIDDGEWNTCTMPKQHYTI